MKVFHIAVLLLTLFFYESMMISISSNNMQQLINIDKLIINANSHTKTNNVQHSHLNIIKILKTKISLINTPTQQLKLQTFPSLTYSKKTFNSFSFIYRIAKNNYYSVDGELLVSYDHSEKQHFYYGIRNQFSYFAEISYEDSDRIIEIRKLKSLGNRFTTESICSINHQTQSQYTQFLSTSSANTKYFIFVVGKQQILQVFDKNCKFLKTVNLKNTYIKKKYTNEFDNEYKSLIRVNNDFIAFSQNDIKILHIGPEIDKIQKCAVIPDKILEIKSDENSLNRFYVLTQKKVYEYQLSPYCKVINYYYIPTNATIYSVGKSIFVMSNDINYYFEKNTPSPKVLQLPQSFNKNSSSRQILMNKKNQNSYIISAVDVNIDLNSTIFNIQIFSMGTESQQLIQDVGFSKVRIPLILCSFCLIAYLTFRKKNEQQNEEEQQKIKSQSIDKLIKNSKQRSMRKQD